MKETNKFRIREKVLLLIAVTSLGAAGMQMARAAGPEGPIGTAATVAFQQEIGDVDGIVVEGFDDEFFSEDIDELFFEDDYFETIATAIGIDIDTLFDEMDSGKSLAEIATANGVDPQVVIDALVADEMAFIDELEQSGEISAEEAAEWRDETAGFIAFEVNNAYPDSEAIGAAVIGISVEALWDEIDAGKTVAEIATANGVEPQAVIDAAVSAENAHVDAMVAAGLLDEAEATEMKAANVEFITDMVNNTQTMIEFEDFDVAFDDDFFEDAEFAEDAYFSTAATVIGIDIEALFVELDSGKSLAEIATANGVEPQAVVDALVADENAFIDELEQSGEISAEEAADWRAESAEFIAFEVNHACPNPEAIGAAVIGLSVEDLWSEIDAGKTIADVATANGVDPQAVIDAAVSAENEYVDAMLAAGLIDEAEAADWKADNLEFMTELVNNTHSFEDDMFGIDEAFEVEIIEFDSE